jgi:3-isopropylmalate/(R)-2-methylmalate dehydratase small subunit
VESPGAEVTVDVDTRTLAFEGRRVEFPLEPFARYCLLNGLDELGYLLEREKDIAAFEGASGPVPWTTG